MTNEKREASVRRRQQRSATRHAMKAGVYTIDELLVSTPTHLATLPVYRVLLWVPRLSHDRLALLNTEAIKARVNLLMPVGALTLREKDWLAKRLVHDVR